MKFINKINEKIKSSILPHSMMDEADKLSLPCVFC